MKEIIYLDGITYRVEVLRRVNSEPGVVRLLIPAYQPNESAQAILRTCVESIKKFTSHDQYELWIVDNNSPLRYAKWLYGLKDVNVILNRTEPRPPDERTLVKRLAFMRNQTKWGSYANAVGIELALRCISEDTSYVMTLHMDTMCCHPDWLDYIRSKMTERTRVAGVCLEHHRTPEGVVHILGCMYDYQTAKQLGANTFPDLPHIDVGDRITIEMRKAGYEVFVCKNTYNSPEIADTLPASSPFRVINVVRVLNDSGDVIFMHLGRGIPKAGNYYYGKTSSADKWVDFFRRYAGNSELC